MGIGETTPLAKLHIKRGDSGLSSLNAAGDHIFLENTGANGTGITLASGNTSNGSIIFGDEDSNYRGVLIYDHSADAMKFVTAAAERTRIQATGKTAWSANGIGDVTSVPRDFAFYTEGATNGVEVRSNDERLVFLGAGGSSGTAVDSGYLAISNGGTTKIAMNANGDSYFNGGNVAIGHDSPLVELDITKSQSSATKILVRNTSSNDNADAAVSFLTQGNVDFTIGIDQSAGSHFKISKHETLGNNDALTINTSGHVNKPLQPAFDAGRNAGYVTDDQDFIQDAVRTNVGSHYNSSNGRFTAPVAG